MTKEIKLLDGTKLSNLGIGSWKMGDSFSKRKEELESIKYALDNGIKLIDTAEMYGNGNSEKLIGEAIKGYDRDDLFLVSKVLPSNAGKEYIFKSCENSLKRMKIDYLDLYLLHWRGNTPLKETEECMIKLIKDGKIKRWGVSNMDIDDMEEIMGLSTENSCMVNQVLYHLGSRGIEFSLKPYTDNVNSFSSNGAAAKQESATILKLIVALLDKSFVEENQYKPGWKNLIEEVEKEFFSSDSCSESLRAILNDIKQLSESGNKLPELELSKRVGMIAKPFLEKNGVNDKNDRFFPMSENLYKKYLDLYSQLTGQSQSNGSVKRQKN